MISFRVCTSKDMKELRALCIQTFSDTYKAKNTPENFNNYINSSFSEAQLSKELNDQNAQFLFVQDGDQILGYLKLNEKGAQTEASHPNGLEIERIYLLKTAQGKGLGRLMINKSIEIAQKKGKSPLWLGVWDQNTNAIAFYQKMGFKIMGTHDFILGDDVQRDFVMEMVVSDSPN